MVALIIITLFYLDILQQKLIIDDIYFLWLQLIFQFWELSFFIIKLRLLPFTNLIYVCYLFMGQLFYSGLFFRHTFEYWRIEGGRGGGFLKCGKWVINTLIITWKKVQLCWHCSQEDQTNQHKAEIIQWLNNYHLSMVCMYSTLYIACNVLWKYLIRVYN